jgi:hypothetical protein
MFKSSIGFTSLISSLLDHLVRCVFNVNNVMDVFRFVGNTSFASRRSFHAVFPHISRALAQTKDSNTTAKHLGYEWRAGDLMGNPMRLGLFGSEF